jgi:hypothetical protein
MLARHMFSPRQHSQSGSSEKSAEGVRKRAVRRHASHVSSLSLSRASVGSI